LVISGGVEGGDHDGSGVGSSGGFDPDSAIREAFDTANPSVLGCLTTELGFDTYAQIREGDYSVVTPEVGDSFEFCYELHGQQIPIDFGTEVFSEGDFREDFPDEGFVPPDEFHVETFDPSFDPPSGFAPPSDLPETFEIHDVESFDAIIPTEDFEIHDASFDTIQTEFIVPDEFESFIPTEDFLVPDVSDIPEIPEDFVVPEEDHLFESSDGAYNNELLLANPFLLFFLIFVQ